MHTTVHNPYRDIVSRVSKTAAFIIHLGLPVVIILAGAFLQHACLVR